MIYGPGCVSMRTGPSLSDETDSEKRKVLLYVQIRLEADSSSSSVGAGMLDDPRIGYESI